MKRLVMIISLVGVICSVITLWSYALQNHSGHTGFPLGFLYFVFYSFIFIGVLGLNKRHNMVAVMLMIIAILGLGSLEYFDHTNLLLEYGVWLDRGMP